MKGKRKVEFQLYTKAEFCNGIAGALALLFGLYNYMQNYRPILLYLLPFTFYVPDICLGTMWSGMEPEDGVYNETYVEIMRDIIDRLADRGVYAMLDMHQDCLSSYAT